MSRSKNPTYLAPLVINMKNAKLIFFGNERLATGVSIDTSVLKALVAAGYDVLAVVVNHNQKRSRIKRDPEIIEAARQLNIPVFLPENLETLQDDLQKLQPEAAVLVAYGRIVPKDIIDIFPKGIINLHPSLLPKYRGPTPIEQTILDGATKTGVSLMKLVAQMDEGPVYSQEVLELTGNETKQELANKLLELGKDMLIHELPSILDGSLRPVAQKNAEATHTKPLQKSNGLINWQLPAEVIERQIRAYQGWPKSITKFFGHDVIVTKVRMVDPEVGGDFIIECGLGWLEIEQLTAPSGRTISGAEFLRGYKK